MSQDQGGKSAKWKSLLRVKMGLIVDVNYAWLVNEDITSFERPVNKLYPLEIWDSDNSVVKNSTQNDDVIDYGRGNIPKRLAAERGTSTRWLNKQK